LFKPLNVLGCSIAVDGEARVIDRASIGVVRCILEGGRVRIVFKVGYSSGREEAGPQALNTYP
jgi:hypothetical protein